MIKGIVEKALVLSFYTVLLTGSAFAATEMDMVKAKPDWENPLVFRVNKEPARSMFFSFPDLESARDTLDIANPWAANPFYMSLNGQWKFHWSPTIEQKVADFYQTDFDDTDWTSFPVPGCWEMNGYGKIWYTNALPGFMFDSQGKTRKEFTEDQLANTAQHPFIPKDPNPVGAYRRTFMVPQEWMERETYIHFAGVLSAFNIWVNGEKVGYSQDSFTPAEFNLTDYIQAGENMLAIEVFRWSDGSYLELQDMLQFSGIHRDVYIYSRPKVHIRDLFVQNKLNQDLTQASLTITASISNVSTAVSSGLSIEAFLTDMDDYMVGGGVLCTKPLLAVGAKTEVSCELDGQVDDIALWDPEKPNLYQLYLVLKDEKGKALEVIRTDCGFRHFEIRGRQLFLNNKRFFIKGVNRHDHDPHRGKAITYDWMLKDIQLMKQLNLNMVRTSHYPNDVRWYMLCNRFGIGVLDEANHESHGFLNHVPTDYDVWVAASEDRMKNMIERDKNNPCVLMWSSGNESGMYYNKSHKAMERVARAIDPARPIFCESGTRDNEGWKQAKRVKDTTDFVAPMYGGLDKMNWYLNELSNETRPFFFCEYTHAMGNAIGNLKGKWDMIYDYESKGLNGGFIWDWVDQAIYLPVPGQPGTNYLADGRDFGTAPSAGNFCLNGVIFADRTLPPKAFEVRKVYQSFAFEGENLEKGSIRIKNRNGFTDLNEYKTTWQMLENGKVIQSGSLGQINLAPKSETIVNIPFTHPVLKSGSLYHLDIQIELLGDSSWAKVGYRVAGEQFKMPFTCDKKQVQLSNTPPVKMTRDENFLTVSGNQFSVTFTQDTAEMMSYKVDGRELICAAPHSDIDTAWIDNHGNLAGSYFKAGLDKLAVKDTKLSVLDAEPSRIRIRAQKSYYSPDNKTQISESIDYTVLSNGWIQVEVNLKNLEALPKDTFLPRLGIAIGLPKEYDNCEYLGRGPHDNYSDRCYSAHIRDYRFKVSDNFVPYPRVQDQGNREDVYWMALRNDQGQGLLIVSDDSLSMSALPYNQTQMKQAAHPYQLPLSSSVELRVAWKVSGVGNASCGPPVRSQYRVPLQEDVKYGFSLRPLCASSNATEIACLGIPSSCEDGI